jgi:hypothetical protein
MRPIVSRQGRRHAVVLVIHPVRGIIARRVAMVPITSRAAAVVVSCHGRLIVNPPTSVQSHPPCEPLVENAIVVGAARCRVGSTAEGLVGSGSGGWLCLGSRQLIQVQNAECRMQRIAVLAVSILGRNCQRSDWGRPGGGCARDARVGGRLGAVWFQAEAEGNDAMSRKREVGAVPVKSRGVLCG